jgi:hypothetical protein
MVEWMFDRHGKARIIFDGGKLRSSHGVVVAWIKEPNVYYLGGQHAGWFEDGVLFDSRNHVLGFLRDAEGHLPSRPGLAGTPGMPGLAGTPGRPGFAGTPGRPGRGGWSSEDIAEYFET